MKAQIVKTTLLIIVSLSTISSFSQRAKLSVEGSYFQIINEEFQQGQYKPLADVGFRILFTEDKFQNFGFSVNGNFSQSSYANYRNYNTIQFRLISCLFTIDSSRLHPFYGITLSRFSNQSVQDFNVSGGSFNNGNTSTIDVEDNNWTMGPTIGFDFYLDRRKIVYLKFQYDLLFRYQESTYLKVSNLLKFGVGVRIGNSYRD